MTNQELAAQMIGMLETAGSDWGDFNDALGILNPAQREGLSVFGQRVVEWTKLMRLAAQRLGKEKP